ncbi:hypothetical protein DRW03_11510 [Corallococcus sp. H22C18031201]|uniref:threonine/serine ThrE exporter family protein n=1 Tax=Citreicoccus inhibens TaxID=2849499 RepID=UPI000E7233CD|nr:threonine/serine exporter family protein [Citreicoccus inhibens]MBU8896407.1 threonine/serine exporter family protein [Citreicoccus inhibens]RJS24209.1 hypothetical protein DRW03_11510 [Corallococcus sp. H22C18031201]
MADTRESQGSSDDEATVSFLCDLVRALHVSYQAASLVEARVKQVARAWGLQVELFTLQSVAILEVVSGLERRAVELDRLPFNPHWNLTRASAVLGLCDDIAAGRKRVPEAHADLKRIMASPPVHPGWLVYLAYGVYGAAVAVRVGGAWLELAAAFVVGVLAGAIHFGTLRSQQLDLQKSFLGAFLGTLVAFLLTWVLPPFDAARALFGGITLLVPAMVVTLGSLELVTESVEAGTPRLLYGLLRFVMMGVGIAAAGTAWGLVAPLPLYSSAHALPHPLALAIVAVGGLALAVCMSARARDVVPIVAAVLLAYGTQELTKAVLGDRGSPLVSSFVLGVAGLWYGRRPGCMPNTVIMPGLLQLAPGFMGTQAILALLGVGANTDARLFNVLLVALQIVMGLIFAALLARPPVPVVEPDP